MNKKCRFCIVIVLIVILSCFSSIAENIDIDSLSAEELAILQERIQEKLDQPEADSEQTTFDRKIEFEAETAIIYVGKTSKLQVNTTRLTDQAPKVTKLNWTSDNPEIATVSAQGIVKGISVGETKIHASANDDNSITASITVSIRASVASINVSNDTIVLLLGGAENTDKGEINASVLPGNAFDKSLSFSSSNPKVVEVDNNGNLQAKSAGKAIITIKTEDKSLSAAKTAKCNVVVNQAVETITIKDESIRIGTGKTFKITATINPSNATQKELEYISSDESVATVTKAGVITGKKPGSCTITVKSKDGSNVETTCNVSVNQQVTGIKLSESKTIYLRENETKILTFTISPDDATDKNVVWTSNNTQVATVSSSGNKITIKGISGGSAKITGKAKDGSNKQVAVTVQVEPNFSLQYVDLAGYELWGYHYYVYKFKNTSKTRTIDGLTVRYWAEDVYHNKLRSFGFGDYEEEVTLNTTIKPGQTKKTEQIHTYGFDDAKYLHINVVKVHYTDGTTVYNDTNDFSKYFTW